MGMEQVKFGCGMGNFRAVGQKVGWVNLESGTGDSLGWAGVKRDLLASGIYFSVLEFLENSLKPMAIHLLGLALIVWDHLSQLFVKSRTN